MNQALTREWQHTRAWGGRGRGGGRPGGLRRHFSWDQPHSACGGLPPMSRFYGEDNVMAHNS